MMSKSENGNKIMPLIHFVVMCAIVAIFHYLPPLAPITEDGMYILGVFFGFIYGVMAWQLIIPSLWGIFMLGFCALIGHTTALAGSFGGAVVMQMFFLFALIQLVQDENIHKVIATWSLSRKFIQGKPLLYSVVVLLAAVLIGMVNVFLSIFVLWAILYGIFEAVGYQKHETYSVVMLTGVVFFSMMGLILFPFVDNGLIIMAAYAGITGTPLPYLSYVAVMAPSILVMAVVWVLIGKVVFHMDTSKIAGANESMLDMSCLKLTKRQKATIVEVLLFLCLILGQAMIPKDIPILGLLSSANVYGVIFIVLVVGVVWHIDGKPLMNVPDLLSRGIMFDTWLLTAFVMLLTAYLTNADTGVTAFCVSILQPLLGGMPLYVMVLIVMAFAFIATNVANNIVITLCVLPIMYAMSNVMGFAIEPIALIVIMASHIALLTPAASGPAAVMFANQEWLSKSDIYKHIPILLIAMVVVCVTFGYAWANVIF